MLTISSHGARAIIDSALFFIMIHLDIYNFTDIVLLLIGCRIVVGHLGRMFQYVIGGSDEAEGCATGIIANIIKTALEVAILLNIYGVFSAHITIAVVALILGRNIFEALSLCEQFSE